MRMATLRNLKIKTSTCKRIVKELHSNKKEVERETAKTADMESNGADPYDLKQQDDGSDCCKRVEAALSDLKGTLAQLKELDQKEGPKVDEARSTIGEVEQFFE